MLKILYQLRFKIIYAYFKTFNRLYWKAFGMELGKNVSLKNAKVTWAHKVKIGNDCTLEHNIYFKYDGPYSEGKSIIVGNNCFIGANVEFNICKKLEIGNNVLIASGTKIVDHNHGIEKGSYINIQPAKDVNGILIEEDVWIGFNSVILPGSKIRKGAILAAQSVLNKEMGEYEIWAGVPAKKIGVRQ